VPSDPKLIVGHSGRDDAAVYRLDDETALVFTTDFFMPVVDDPFDFGRIAAANALSDVYAMGGRPILALNIVGFPTKQLPLTVLSEILAGGSAVLQQAGVALGGGHSIDDEEPKYGLAVVGLIHPDKIWTNGGAQPGDKLVLTKPLGIGVITTAIKRGLVDSADVAETVRVMTTLNRGAADVVANNRQGVHAVTDVTGFGLLGHLSEMIDASSAAGIGVSVQINSAAVPVLAAGRRFAKDGVAPGGSRANLEHIAPRVSFSDQSDATQLLLADAQTSGGLLIAVAPNETDHLIDLLIAARTPAAAVIGEFLPGDGQIVVV
jgi:selenide, water dikinase